MKNMDETTSPSEISQGEAAKSIISQGNKSNWQRLLLATAAIVVVAAVTVGGTVWYFMDQKAKSVADSNEKSVAALQKQVDELKTDTTITGDATSTASTPESQNTTSTQELTSNSRYPNTYSNAECAFNIDYPSGYKLTYGGQENAIFSSAAFWAQDNSFNVFCTGGDAALIKSWSDYSTTSLPMKTRTNQDGSVSYDTISNNGRLISIQFSDPNNVYTAMKTKILNSLVLR